MSETPRVVYPTVGQDIQMLVNGVWVAGRCLGVSGGVIDMRSHTGVTWSCEADSPLWTHPPVPFPASP